MTRTDELINTMRQMNKNDVIPKDEWIVFLLTDIAKSLAIIADALDRKSGKVE